MDEPALPPAIVEAQRAQRDYRVRHVLPSLAWMVLSTVPTLPLAMNLVTAEAGQIAILVAWLAGLLGAVAHLGRGQARAQRAEALLAAWRQQQALRAIAAAPQADPDPEPDPLVHLVGPEARELVAACRARARALRHDADTARAALAGLPPDGPGARSLADAIARNSALADEVDDELAGLHAVAMGRTQDAADALARLRAVSEVEAGVHGAATRARPTRVAER